jgi:phage head maturation protease
MPETQTQPAAHGAGEQIQAQGLPPLVRAAAVQPSTLDENARTVEVVWTTGQTVRRRRLFDEDFDEQLEVSEQALRLERLNGGAPVLDSHDSFELRNIIGVVEPNSVRIQSGQATATLRFSEREEVEPIYQDIRAGIIRNVSVGYRVHRVVVEQREGDVDLVRVIDWEPMEISMVAVGADSDARVRSQAGWTACGVERAAAPERDPSQSQQKRTLAMDNQQTRGTQPADDTAPANTPGANTPAAGQGANASADDTTTAERRGAEAERRRVREIRELCRSVGLDSSVADQMVDNGTEVSAARQQALEHLAQRRQSNEIQGVHVSGGASSEDPRSVRAAMATALASRHADIPVEGQAGEYVHHSVRDIATDLMRAHGVMVDTRNKHEIIKRAFETTSDFAGLLADVANKVLLAEYQSVQPSYRLLARRRRFNDFKPHNMVRAGDFPAFLEKDEHGEFKSGYMGDNNEKIQLITYGRILPLTRQALINDDLGAFADMASKIGMRSLDHENALVFQVLQDNPQLTDGKALFSADHGNLAGTGGAVSIANIGKGREAMRKQKSVDGMRINVTPSFLVVAPENETTAEQLVSQNLQADSAGNVNPFAGRLQVIADANLTGNAWYLMAAPQRAETLVYGYLAGAEGPQVAVENGFSVDGVRFRAHLDFAAGPVDFRGAYKNPGA